MSDNFHTAITKFSTTLKFDVPVGQKWPILPYPFRNRKIVLLASSVHLILDTFLATLQQAAWEDVYNQIATTVPIASGWYQQRDTTVNGYSQWYRNNRELFYDLVYPTAYSLTKCAAPYIDVSVSPKPTYCRSEYFMDTVRKSTRSHVILPHVEVCP